MFTITITETARAIFNTTGIDMDHETAAVLFDNATQLAAGNLIAGVDAITRGNRSAARGVLRAFDRAGITPAQFELPPVAHVMPVVVWSYNMTATKSARRALTAAGIAFEYVARENNMHEIREYRGISRRNAYLAARARLVGIGNPDTVRDLLADVPGIVVGAFTTIDPAEYGVFGSAECVNWAGRRTMDDTERAIRSELQRVNVA